MKVLIWFICLFLNALITTVLKYGGITLGALPTVILYGITMWIAKTLCKSWDNHKQNKEMKMECNESQVEINMLDSKATDEIRFCRKCGSKLLEGAEFCNKCGTKIVRGNE